MKKYRKNQWGFSHHFILPVLAFVAVGAIGAYVIAQSSAATAGPSDVVYSVNPSTGSEKYYRYSSATKTSTEYSSDVANILDVSQDQKWILSYDNNFTISALSSSGEKVSYGDLRDYRSYQYEGACTGAATVAMRFHFSKFEKSASSAPKLYYMEGTIPCENGKYNLDKKAPNLSINSIEANGLNKKTVFKFTTHVSSVNFAGWITEVATNGNILAQAEDGSRDYRSYVISAAGKVLFKSAKNQYIYLSENGKKIAYTKDGSYGKTILYVANSNGKSAKKVLSSTTVALTGISPTGSYVLYQKVISKDYKKSALYSLKVSSKKSYKIDSATHWQSGLPGAIRHTRWLPGSNTLVYSKEDSSAKTSQILQAGATGSGKKVLVSTPYDKGGWLTIY